MPGSPDALRRLARARANLIMRAPFFGSLALRLSLAEDPSCEGLWTDGRVLAANPDRLRRLSDDELLGALAHEVLHLALGHHLRRGRRDAPRWNAATDYAVNPLVQEAGLRLPTGRLFDPTYSRLPAEEIYEKLPRPDDEGRDPQGGDGGGERGEGKAEEGRMQDRRIVPDDPGGTGEVRDFPDDAPEARAEEARAWEQAVREAVRAAGGWGRLPARLARRMGALARPRLDWRRELARFVEETARTDYVWTAPNRRYLPAGVVLPSLASRRPGRIVAIVDSSGSVDRAALTALVSECLGLLEAEGQEHGLPVLYVDTAVARTERLFPGDTPRPAGGGGTSFRPGFAWLAARDEEPDAAIYFTDGECEEFPEAPPYPVLWVLPEPNPRFEAMLPFGRVVSIASDR
ncbi:putative metallopeptidase domain containing protein [Desulfovibrio sp. X2]|uniref:vWA domain-containing protein n=1 Tax=Desulfovibrio sp. X2 TaxID=941449 RepID=UPI000358B3F2|nr:VWA-like domain-containing protein [Desulfovibrio sp. X2]EPR40875.1 putative metallopeptidase domain containing protein [Desulfovibrio sp. X2]